MNALAKELGLTFSAERMSRRKIIVRCNGQAVGDVRMKRRGGYVVRYGERVLSHPRDQADAIRHVRHETIRDRVKDLPMPPDLTDDELASLDRDLAALDP